MKTREQFLAEAKLYRAKVNALVRTMFFVLVVAFVVFLGIADAMPGGPLLHIFALGLLLLILVGLAVSAAKYERRLTERYGMICPACLHALFDKNAKLAAKTLRCPFCGQPLCE